MEILGHIVEGENALVIYDNLNRYPFYFTIAKVPGKEVLYVQIRKIGYSNSRGTDIIEAMFVTSGFDKMAEAIVDAVGPAVIIDPIKVIITEARKEDAVKDLVHTPYHKLN